MSMQATPGRRRAAILRLLFNYSTSAFGVISGVVLVPVYLGIFGIGTYGSWLASGDIIVLLGILDGGLTTVFGQKLAESYGSKDFQQFSRYAGAGLLMTVLVCFAMVGITWTVAPFVPAWVKAEASQYGPISLGVRLAGMGAALSWGQLATRTISDAWQRTIAVGTFTMSGLLSGVAAIIWGLWQGWGVAAIGLGAFVRGAVLFVPTICYVVIVWRRLTLPALSLSMADLKRLLGITAPVFFGRTAGLAMTNSESLIVVVFLNPVLAATLALTSKVYQIAALVLNPIHGSVAAGLAHLKGERDKDYQLKVAREFYALFSAVSAVVIAPSIAMNPSFLGVWVGTEKYAGDLVNLAAALSALLLSHHLCLGTIVVSYGQLRRAGRVGIFEAILRGIAMVSLVPLLGIAGMPMAGVVGSGAASVVWLWLLQRYLGLDTKQMLQFIWSGWRPLVLVLPVAGAISIWLPHLAGWGTFAGSSMGMGLVMLFGVLLSSSILLDKFRALRK